MIGKNDGLLRLSDAFGGKVRQTWAMFEVWDGSSGSKERIKQMSKIFIIVIIAIVVVGVVSRRNTGITTKELFYMLDNKDFFFVNVHVPYEGEIEMTDAFIPYDKISENLNAFPSDKNAKIVLYCRSGSMSAAAVQQLSKMGYTNVYDVSGGMIDWEMEGYSLVRR